MKPSELWQWQQDVRALPKVFGVFCPDENSLLAVYDSREAAQVHIDGSRDVRTIHGLVRKPVIRALPLRTMDIAQRAFAALNAEPQS